jgi:protein O-mannosyl-transferase
MINKENGFSLNIKPFPPVFRQHVFAFSSLFFLLLIIYGNSYHASWQLDDFDNILNNLHIHLKSLSWPDIGDTVFSTPNLMLTRPSAKLSFALNYYFGGANVFGYHVVNVSIHLIASFFLYLLVYNTLNLPLLKETYEKSSYAIALLAAVFWASSPVNISSVTYIVQRMASLAGMGYVMSMFFYLKARTFQNISWRIAFFVLSGVAGGIAISSKESAAMLPIMIFLYDLFLIQGATSENIRKSMLIIFSIILIVSAGIIYMSFFTSIIDYQYWTFSMKERLLTEPRVFLYYVSLLLYPVSSRLTLDHDIHISRSLFDPWSTLPAIVAVIIAILYAFRMSRKQPLLSFCILFFFLNHMIEGTIIPLDIAFEHRNYVPSMFVFVLVGVVIVKSLDFFAYKRSLQFTLAFVIIFLLAAQGHTVTVRNEVFQSQESLWKDCVQKAPDLSRPHATLGYIYAEQGDYAKAIKEITIALNLSRYPDVGQLVTYHVNLGSFYFLMGHNDEKAMFHYREALGINERIASPMVYHNMAFIMLNRGNLKQAHEYGQKAIVYAPNNELAHSNFARILLKEGNLDRAIAEASRAEEIRPGFLIPLATLGEAYRLKRNYSKSEFYWTEYRRRKPYDIIGLFAILELYQLQNKKEKIATTIGQLLSKSRNGNILEMIKRDERTNYPYTPDPKVFRSILRQAFLQLGGSVSN